MLLLQNVANTLTAGFEISKYYRYVISFLPKMYVLQKAMQFYFFFIRIKALSRM